MFMYEPLLSSNVQSKVTGNMTGDFCVLYAYQGATFAEIPTIWKKFTHWFLLIVATPCSFKL